MIVYDVIIIGAGPAGLFAAINVPKDKRVLVLEKNSQPGIKLLMAGSGKCNITHIGNISDFFGRYGDNSRFMRTALQEFTNSDLIEFLRINGINIIVDKNGKVFPASEKAADVLELLLNLCYKQKVIIKTGEVVSKIYKKADHFQIITANNEYYSSKLVIATGGKSYPLSGSTGEGYNFAKAMGHTIIHPKPALTPVIIKNYKFKSISGISLDNRLIKLFRDNKKLREHIGDIGFTHVGLSGPGILDFSRYFESGDTLRINLIDMQADELRRIFIETVESDGKKSIKNFLKRFDLPESLILSILKELGLEAQEQIAKINKTLRSRIIELFCEYPFVIERTGDYNVAMVTTGGIALNEVNPKTMESKLVKNLYFAGEVLDIDGDTGGYNIQAAFSTGYLAGKG